MVRPKIRFLIDLVLLILFLVVGITGLILFIKFPSGSGTGKLSLMGISRHNWADIHNYAGIAMIVLILIHFIINWKMFLALGKTKLVDKKKNKLDKQSNNKNKENKE